MLAAAALAIGSAELARDAPRLIDALRLSVLADATLASALGRASVAALAVALGVLLALAGLRRGRSGAALGPGGRVLAALAGCGLAAAGGLWFAAIARAQGQWLALLESSTAVSGVDVELIAAPARRLMWLGCIAAGVAALPLAAAVLPGCWTTSLGRPQPGARILLPLMNSLALVGLVGSLMWACGHAASIDRKAHGGTTPGGVSAAVSPDDSSTLPAMQGDDAAKDRPVPVEVQTLRVVRYGLLAALSLFVAGTTLALAASSLARKPAERGRDAVPIERPHATPEASRKAAIPEAP
jgi:hypothetical protein